MGKTVIYGTGAVAKHLCLRLEKSADNEEILFSDSNPGFWGKTVLGRQIIAPELIKDTSLKSVVIASVAGIETIPEKLIKDYGIPHELIDTGFVREIYDRTYAVRNRFLKKIAAEVYKKNLQGSVAEVGVFEGEFAKRINKAFKDRKLYLFDTFEGFDARDTSAEKGGAHELTGDFGINVTLKGVLSKMPYPHNVEIRRGYFPDTAIDLSDAFSFVNLDSDLYKPTLAGLEFFYPKMVKGGVILVHDYYTDVVGVDVNSLFIGVSEAVDEFCAKRDICFLPIGDELSIAIMKT